MKKRDIILDFTPLLDIVLTMIFFFVMFCNTDSESYKQKAEQAQKQTEQAKTEQEQAQLAQQQADRLLAEIAESNSRMAANIVGINSFSTGRNVVMKLIMNDSGWQISLTVNGAEQTIEQGDSQQIFERLRQALEQNGHSSDDTILCEFVYDGSKGGSAAAYREIYSALEKMQSEYDHFFFSLLECSEITEGDVRK